MYEDKDDMTWHNTKEQTKSIITKRKSHWNKAKYKIRPVHPDTNTQHISSGLNNLNTVSIITYSNIQEKYLINGNADYVLPLWVCNGWTDGVRVDRIIKIWSLQHPCWQECVPLFPPVCVYVCVCRSKPSTELSSQQLSDRRRLRESTRIRKCSTHKHTHKHARTHTDVRDLFRILFMQKWF